MAPLKTTEEIVVVTEVVKEHGKRQQHHHCPIEVFIQEGRWDRVEKRLLRDPDEIQPVHLENLHGHKTQAYTLHYLCRKKDVPASLVQAFVDLEKEAISAPDSILQELPIHIACQHDAPVDVLKILVNAYPEGLLKKDRDGNLPLHYACSFESPDAARYLIDQCPESVSLRNKKNQTPLHRACSRYNVSLASIKDLIGLYADACMSRDWQGRLPIHSACMWKADSSVIELLLKTHPEALREKDDHHLTPYAICRKVIHLDAHHPVVQLLRKYHKKQESFFGKSKDLVQYQAENLTDALRLPHHKSCSHANAM